MGFEALVKNESGENNTALGDKALGLNITGSANTVIGDRADTSNPNDSNSIVIGAGAKGNGNGSIQIGTSENISTFIGGQEAAPSLNPTAIRNVSGLNKRGYPLYVLPTGEIVRGSFVNPIP